MKIYFACDGSHNLLDQTGFSFPQIENILVPYYGLTPRKMEGLDKRKPFLDSGAFSAFTLGAKISLSDYIQFIHRTKELWSLYANLDVIGDYKATRTNQEIMEKEGLNPLATFHYKSPIEELDRILERYNHIALGGLVPIAIRRGELENWLDYCFARIVKKNPLPKVHGFGVNSLWALKKYPFYSVDATSWKQGGRYGRISLRKGLNIVSVGKENKRAQAYYFNEKTYKQRNRKNVEVLLELEQMLTELWAKRGITFHE